MKKAYATSLETGLPFSEAVEANGFLYISGQIHLDTDGNLIDGSIEEKTHQTMKNIGRVLETAGYDFSHVVKMEIFLPNLSHRQAVSSIYETYLSHPFPARAMIGIKELPMGADIEITAIAYKTA